MEILSGMPAVWSDWAIYWTLVNFSRPVATIIFAQISHILRQFCKDIKIFNFYGEIIFGQIIQTFSNCLLVSQKASISFIHILLRRFIQGVYVTKFFLWNILINRTDFNCNLIKLIYTFWLKYFAVLNNYLNNGIFNIVTRVNFTTQI